MKYSKRYIAFTFILALIFVSNFYIYAKDSSTLGAFRGAQIDNTIWSPLVAADVNGTTIRLKIENKEYTSEDEHVYMDENRNIMVPVSMLRDALNSCAHVYNKNELLVEKHSLTADFKLADDNGFVQYKGQFYASLDKLWHLLGFCGHKCTRVSPYAGGAAFVFRGSYEYEQFLQRQSV